MTSWVESHTVLGRHRKLIELAKDLRLKPVYVLGHLHSLWHAALEQQEDGDLSSWSDDLIAETACYEGDAPRFVSLLQQHGWLDGKLLHDWLDYAGKYLTAKYRTANPRKLRQILLKHKSVNSRSKIRRSPIGLGSHKVGSKSERGNGLEGGILPDWLSVGIWNEFREHRKLKRATMNAMTEARVIGKLAKLKEQGQDPMAVIEQSIEQGWTGLFPVGGAKETAADRQREKMKKALRQGLDE